MSLNKEEEQFIQRWSKNERRGKYFYIITFGLLWGNAVAIGSKLLSSYGKAGLWNLFATSEFLIKLLIFNIVGLGLYAFKWNSNYKRYKQLKSIQEESMAVQQ
ncbi:hypothetical protein WG947_13745 [Pontibacter sp. H259]|uniref:hypothetical protein n=1 Tax=Pontibacter sp. H259 TaxID=3133421 RepID=UPI0030C3A272